jgi:hypothetical protein
VIPKYAGISIFTDSGQWKEIVRENEHMCARIYVYIIKRVREESERREERERERERESERIRDKEQKLELPMLNNERSPIIEVNSCNRIVYTTHHLHIYIYILQAVVWIYM